MPNRSKHLMTDRRTFDRRTFDRRTGDARARGRLPAAGLLLLALVAPAGANAAARGVGLGLAAGAAYSPTKLAISGSEQRAGESFAWGFFVDIPLLDTFYVSPAAMLYELRLDSGDKKPVTDIDLNFKFIVPISSLSLGVGFTVGLSNAASDYAGHFGGLGYAAYKLVPNFALFALLQYKKMMRNEARSVDNLHGFAGGIFYF